MNMYIYPKHLEDASKPHWTVKLLRTFGVMQIIGFTAFGFIFASPIAQSILNARTLHSIPDGLVLLLGALIGLMAGIIFSASTFAIAMVVDDLHAMRQHSEAWVAFETDNPHLGK